MASIIARTDKRDPQRTQELEDHNNDMLAWASWLLLDTKTLDQFIAFIKTHDIAKATAEFQSYIHDGPKPEIAHNVLTAYIIYSATKDSNLALIIYSHHRGLANVEDMLYAFDELESEFPDLLKGQIQESERAFQDIYNKNLRTVIKSLKHISRDDPYQTYIHIKNFLSLLVDADGMSARGFEYHKPMEKPVRLDIDTRYAQAYDSIQEKWSLSIKQNIFNLLSSRRQIHLNQIRTATQKTAIEIAKKSTTNILLLPLPVGIGKTLTSVAVAMEIAKKYGKKRIIYITHYLTVINQTASVYKEIFGEDAVLEHHSNVLSQHDGNAVFDYSIQDWNAEIIISTNVQFFESIFTEKINRTKKFHSLMDSVVIIDEMQTIPYHVMEPTIKVLNEMAPIMNMHIIISTATMPDVFKREDFINGIDSKNTTSLVPDIKNIYRIASKRVKIKYIKGLNPISKMQLYHKVRKESHPTLVVFNSKHDAYDFFNIMNISGHQFDTVYYLSAILCPKTVAEIVLQIKNDLADGKNICLISTQLIEVGVDIDFDVGYRAMAPYENIKQIEGRINRNNRLYKGILYLFELHDKESHIPNDASYKHLTNLTKDMLKKHPKIHSDYYGFFKYSSGIIKDSDQVISGKGKVITDKYSIARNMRKQNYKKIGEDYMLISTITRPVFIYDFDVASSSIYSQILEKDLFTANDEKKIQPYCVNFYPHQLDSLRQRGILASVFISNPNAVDVSESQFELLTISKKYYDPITGFAPITYRS